MTWPLETEGLRDFARGKRAMLVIEEKRGFVESQIRDALYHLAGGRPARRQRQDRPARRAAAVAADGTVAGNRRRAGWRRSWAGRAEPARAPRAAAAVSVRTGCCSARPRSAPAARMRPRPNSRTAASPAPASAATSWRWTTAPRRAPSPTWAARARPSSACPASPTCKHMFANIGDGTYQHSGSLAIRQAVAAKTRMTYKLLFNDAVAMTGGQPAEGAPTVPMIAAQTRGRGREAHRHRRGRGGSAAAARRRCRPA